MSESSLKPVIHVDKDKCVNCHRCIAVCPSKFCNDGSYEYVKINHDMCIGCGACIEACKHGARRGLDDFEQFLSDLKNNEKIVAFVAPAVAANFEGKDLELNTWLKSIGVKAVFDVSLGAELTTKSYVEELKRDKPKLMISQPCPALVSYIEIYKPELIPYLAKSDSPMAHTARMIKEFYPEYKNCKLAAISPCYAKRREFDENGLGDYNVTMKSLSDYFHEQRIDLSKLGKTPYDNLSAERAVLYSTPGGLMRTAERFVPGISKKIRKIEGQPTMAKYFNELSDSLKSNKKLPYVLIDCLNCERGCNGGAGTVNQGKSLDEIELLVEKRMARRKKSLLTGNILGKSIYHLLLNRYWKPKIYNRNYTNRNANYENVIRIPTNTELDDIYAKMLKTCPQDHLNCGACGYDSCKEMATALYNGINQYEHCYYYVLKKNELKQKTDNEISNSIYQEVSKLVDSTKDGVDRLTKNLQQLHDISDTNSQTIESIRDLNKSLASVWEIVSLITTVADQAKIIAFNAELEASSAGEAGKNFHIVASEIRRLSDGIIDSTKDIKSRISDIQDSSDRLILVSEQGTIKIEKGCLNAQELEEKLQNIKEATEMISASAEKLQFQ